MTLFEWLPLIILHLYLVVSVCALTAFFMRQKRLRTFALWLACFAIALHGIELALTLWQGVHSRAFFIMGFSWCIALLAIGAWRMLRQPAFVLLAIPIVALVFLFGVLTSHVTFYLPSMFSAMFFSIHVLALSLSFALMTIGFLAAVLFLVQERRLKRKRPALRFFKDLPSLTLLDRINAWTIYAGFPLYFFGLFGGFINTYIAYSSFFSGDPKEWVSLVIVIFYAYCFIRRLCSRLYGKRAAVFAIWLFGTCVFSLTIVNVMFATHHTLMGQ